MNTQVKSNQRGPIAALAGLLLLQVAAAAAWHKWFRHDAGASLGVVPQMQEYTRERRYDDAIQIGLRSLKHSSADDVILQQIAVVYLRRAQIESGDQAQYTAQAVEYAEKALAANSTNQLDLYDTARVFDIAGDFSAGKKCDYYKRSVSIFQDRAPLLGGESVSLEGKNVPTAGLRQENGYLLQRVQAKMSKAGCR